MTPQQLFRALVASGDVVADKLDEISARAPDRTFIYYGEEDRPVSYAEFRREADRLAAGLAALGVQPDDRISVFTRNSYIAALAMFAAWRAGAVYCPVNFLYTGKLLTHQLADTAPKVLLTDVNMSSVLAPILGELRLPKLVMHLPRESDHDFTGASMPPSLARATTVHRLDDVMATSGHFTPVARGYGDVANIVYTSGTTGPAKGVVQPFRWINQYTFLYRQLLNADDTLYCDLPMYHVGGAFFRVAKAAWLGATVALYDKFSSTHFWQRIERSGATHAILLDVMVPWLMSAPHEAHERQNALKMVHMQPLPPNHNDVARRFGIDFVTCGFGQTESGLGFLSLIEECPEGTGTAAAQWRGRPRGDILSSAAAHGVMRVDGTASLKKGFMGKPCALFDVCLLDDADAALPDGEIGQLAIRPRFPELLLKTYFNRSEAMLKACSNLWFHTGDACSRDADGVYHFVDRMGDVFRVRGEKVSSYTIEALLNEHPKIRATAAVAVPAAVGEEEDCAVFVQLIEGESLSADALLEHAREIMPRYMVPKYVRFIDALPLTPTNKIEKYKLRQRLLEELRSGTSA
ncbi:MAG TPA: AMP-binding protein [Steroidobacter sp.]|uniref:class I adenylate-forming enzyme family protein n=1 Tax=Steroidobacter sp. TaxID=1978227 RepID=UPI002EDB9AB6